MARQNNNPPDYYFDFVSPGRFREFEEGETYTGLLELELELELGNSWTFRVTISSMVMVRM